jgi:conjugal transfer/entry exclusion protein
MFNLFIAMLRGIIWPAVLSVVFTAASLAIVVFDASNLAGAISCGLASVSMALLAQRA